MSSEFEIIKKYFSFSPSGCNGVNLSVGDDAAVLQINASQLVVATDTLIEGVHFPRGMAANHIASRVVGVNLSDFAAMGVKPRWFTMALTVPEFSESWFVLFSKKMAELCDRHNIALVGGDTTKGVLNITLTVMGEAEGSSNSTSYISREGANLSDDIWVSGNLGKGAAALALLQNDFNVDSWSLSSNERESLLNTFYAPEPRLELGLGLRKIATSAIDISDGLLADAKHIAEQSKVCLSLQSNLFPVDAAVKKYTHLPRIKDWVLSGGDEYELLFTVPKAYRNKVNSLAGDIDLPCTLIGSVVEGSGVKLDGELVDSMNKKGYVHF